MNLEILDKEKLLLQLKNELVTLLRNRKQQIPRLTRNLSFGTLNEQEMIIYLQEWKQKRLQQQNTDIDETDTDRDKEMDLIDVNRLNSDQIDIPLPILSLEEVESLPLASASEWTSEESGKFLDKQLSECQTQISSDLVFIVQEKGYLLDVYLNLFDTETQKTCYCIIQCLESKINSILLPFLDGTYFFSFLIYSY